MDSCSHDDRMQQFRLSKYMNVQDYRYVEKELFVMKFLSGHLLGSEHIVRLNDSSVCAK